MKVLELKEKAKSLGIKGYYKMKKQEYKHRVLVPTDEDDNNLKILFEM